MTTTAPDVAAAVELTAGLRSALDQLAAALAAGDAEAVLAAEPALQAAVSRRFGAPVPVTGDARDRMVHDLACARAALARCRALGAGAAAVAGVTLDALGRDPSYSRHGAGPTRSLRGRGLKARV